MTRRSISTCLAVLAALLAAAWLGSTVLSQADWYNPDWAYRRAVTISTSCGELTGYQVLVTLDGSFDFEQAQPEGQDVRVTDEDGVTALPFWIENWDAAGQVARIWVKVPSLPAGAPATVYLYYGNPAAPAAGNGDDTFELFDDEWQQFGGDGDRNPVLTAGQAWWESYLSFPMVFEDTSLPDRPRFHMLYDGHAVIGHAKGYATSPDLIHWTEYDAGVPHPPNPNPIMGTGYAGGAPFAWGDAMKVGSTYYLYVSRGPGTIYRAQSTDLITWTNFLPITGGSFGTGAAILKQGDGITPIVVSNRYWMVYFPGNGPGSMYLASTPANGDLLAWTPWAGNPLLVPTAGGWDQSGLWTPSFARLGDSYYIYYQGNGPAGWEVGFATAPAYGGGGTPIRPDQAVWTKSDPDSDGDPDPVIQNGPGGSWDSTYCIDPMIRQFDGTFYVFYTGNVANGFATSDSPEGPWTKFGEGPGPAKWVAGGNPTLSEGILTFGSGSWIKSTATYQYHAVGYRADFASGMQNTWGGFIDGSTLDRTMIGTSQTDSILYLRNLVPPSTNETRAAMAGDWFGAFHVYEVLWEEGQSTGMVDHGVSTATLTAAVPSVALPVTFYHYNGTNPISLDWVFVRKYCGAEPQVAIGPQEQMRGVEVTPRSLEVWEPDSTASFTVTLASQPTATVDIPLSASNTECQVSPDSVTLGTSNWQSGITATVTAVDDDIVDGDQTCLVLAGPTSSADTNYDGLDPVEVTVTVHDDDIAGIVVAPTSLEVDEPDGWATFVITLTSQPTATVDIPLSASNTECQVSPDSVSLGASNWQSGVIATVTAVDDDIADGDQTCLVLAGPTTSADINYDGLDPVEVTVTVHDDDIAGIGVTPTSLEVDEPDGWATFVITLTSQPTAIVHVPLSASNSQCQVSPDSVTLDASNWQSGVIATVTAVDDDIVDGDQTCLVLAGPTDSADINYDGLDPVEVTVTVHDDDFAGIRVAPTSLVVSEPDGWATFVITLTSQPAAIVHVPLSASNTQCQVSPDSVTLDASNWQSGAIATVTAVDDDIMDGDQTCRILTGPSDSADTNYDGLDPADVIVTVHDDDLLTWVYLPVVARCWPPTPGSPTLYPIDNLDGDGIYIVQWSAAARAGVYVLEEAKDNAFAVSTEIYTGPATSLAVSGRGAARYYYRVKARNSCGDGAWSNVEWTDVLWEAEPNDDPLTQANGPVVSGLTYYGTFPNTADRKDYFYFDLPVDGYIELWLTDIPPGQNYDLILRDANLKDVGDSSEYGSSPEYIRVDNQPPGRYYIQVYHNTGLGSGQPYHLRVEYQSSRLAHSARGSRNGR